MTAPRPVRPAPGSSRASATELTKQDSPITNGGVPEQLTLVNRSLVSRSAAAGLPPVISSVQPASAAQGQLTPILVTGMNFDRGAALAFSDPAIAVDGATSGSCTQVQSSISIGLEALAGWAPVTVRNPDHSRGVSNAALRILPASAPTVVSTSPVEGTAGIAPS